MEAPKKRQKLSLQSPATEENELQEGLRVLCHEKKIGEIAHIQATIEAFMGPPPRTIAQACKLSTPKLLQQVIAKVDNEPGDSLLKLPAFRQWQFEQGLENAVVAGHLEMVKVLAVSFPNYEVPSRIVDSALSHGRTEILRWLFAYRQNIDAVVDTKMVLHAVKSGDLETVKWAHAQCLDEEYDVGEAIDEACDQGHLDIMKWLLEQVDMETYVDLSRASSRGHFHIVEWVLSNLPGRWVGLDRVTNECASGGRLDLARLLLYYDPENCNFSAKTVDATAGNGHLEVLKWLLSIKEAESCTTEAMDNAAGNGHLEVVKWLHDNRTEGCTTRAMNLAATNGHVEVVQWLDVNRQEGCTNRAVDGAASNGFLELVKWLLENRSKGCSTNAMDGAAGNGHLHVVKWLLENRTEGCTGNAFRLAAGNGHLPVVLWLLEHKSGYCSKGDLYRAVGTSHFDVALLYFERHPSEPTIPSYLTRSFTWAFLDWLYSYHDFEVALRIMERFRKVLTP